MYSVQDSGDVGPEWTRILLTWGDLTFAFATRKLQIGKRKVYLLVINVISN